MNISIKYYEKAIDYNISMAFNNLGRIYEKGKGVPVDLEKTRKLYEKGVQLNNTTAIDNLGWLYYKALGLI